MSRFSRAEAEAAGWRFFHEQEQFETVESETQGRVNITPASIRAEKYVSLPGQTATLVTEEAETEGKLLERIAAYEAHLRGLPSAQPAPVDESDVPREIALDEDGSFVVQDTAAGSVILPDPNGGDPIRVTDEAYTAAARADALVVHGDDGDGQMVTYGGAREDLAPAIDASFEVSKEAEDQRTAEPDPGETKQVDDGGELAVIRADDEDVDAARDRQIERNKDLEDVRVNLAPTDNVVKAPEGRDLVAGADAGLASRTDLGTEIPGQGQVAGSTEPGEVEVPTEPATLDQAQAGQEAAEQAAIDARDGADNASAPEADGPEAQQAVEDAGAEAEQDAADEAAQPESEEPVAEETRSSDAPADSAPNATPAAQQLAAQNGVDLSQVQGSGKNGKITAPDVEAHVKSNQ